MKGSLTSNLIVVGSGTLGSSLAVELDDVESEEEAIVSAVQLAHRYAHFAIEKPCTMMVIVNVATPDRRGGAAWQSLHVTAPITAGEVAQAWAALICTLVPRAFTPTRRADGTPIEGTPAANAATSKARH